MSLNKAGFFPSDKPAVSLERIHKYYMTELTNLPYLLVGIVLIGIALFALRGVIKVAWKVLRGILILLGILAIAGVVLGYLNLSF